LAELIDLCNQWPTVTPFDVIAEVGRHGEVGPKVRLAPYVPALWPKDGSILLQVLRTTIGDEFKSAFLGLNREIPSLRVGKGKPEKSGVTPKVSLAVPAYPSDEFIFLCVNPTATGEEVRREFRRIKRESSKRRLRMGQWQLKLTIYKMYDKHFSFEEIARKVKKPLSNVHYLHGEVQQDIENVERNDRSETFKEHAGKCPSHCAKGYPCSYAEKRWIRMEDASLRELLLPEPLYNKSPQEDD